MNKMFKYSTFAIAMVGMTSAAQAVDLNVVSWGGAYTSSQMNAYHKPYTAKTGVKINSIDYSIVITINIITFTFFCIWKNFR